MRKLSFFLAAAAFVMAAASCQKTGEVKPAPSTDGSVFTATIDGGLDTRTVLTAENKVNWEEVDSISINGVVYVAAPGSDATTAIFSKNDSKEHPSAPFYAFYPVGIQTGPAAAGVLPAEQKYVAGKITNLPMFAESTTNDLTFKNICAVLAITVDSEEFSSVKSIRLSSSNKALSGAFTVENGKLLLTDSTTVANTVILSADEAVVIPQGDSTVFYIAIPAQTYEKLKIEISADGSDYSKSMRTKRGVKIVTAANTIYPVSFKEQIDPVFYATIGAPTKTTIDMESDKVSWEMGDTITITDNQLVSVKYTASEIDAQGEATFTKASEEQDILGVGPYTAVYGTAPAKEQTYSAMASALPMSAESATTELTFSVSCGLMKLKLSKTGESVKSIAVTGTPTGGSKTTYTLTCEEAQSIASAKDFCIALPAGSYNRIVITNKSGHFCILDPSSALSVSDNKIYKVNPDASKMIFGALNGVFSVSSTKKVRFSQGNLQATCTKAGKEGTSEYSWGFAEHQYDTLGRTSGNATIANQTLGAKVDLFGWVGASGTLAGNATKYGIAVSSNDSRSKDFGNELGDKLKVDWGTTIDNDGTWRSLTIDEVGYLFSFKGEEGEGKPDCTNPTRQGLNAYNVTVAGHKNCIVLYPDGFTGTKVSTGDETSYDTPEEWAVAEAQGVVCLPAAGYRIYSNVKFAGEKSFYWTNSSPASGSNNTSAFPFGVGYVIYNTSPRLQGGSVRLVTEVK